VPFLLQTVAIAVGACILLVAIHPPLAMAVVAAIVLMGAVTLRQAAPLRPRSRLLQDSLGRFTQFVEQQVGGIRVVKGHGFEDVNRADGASRAEHIAEAGVHLALARARFVMLFMLTPASASLAVVGIGSWLATRGSLTAGELFAFLQYMALLMSPVQVGAQVVMVWPQAVAASARIDEVLSAQPDVRPPARPVPLPDGPGRVQFEAVEFGYRPGRPVLNGVSLDIPGGTSVALVGASGGGKSTLASLVPRFYDPGGGRVLLDGADVRNLRLSTLRSAVAMVFEDTVVFTATIRENIALGRPHASDEEVRRAARLAQVEEFVEGLADGYDTLVGEHGASLSGGQRQRLAIARAILRDPRVLILDDAMSAVDPGTDEVIRRGLVEVMRGRTTIIVAHRLETLALADRIVLLGEGRVLAEGTHVDLLDLPAYRRALAIDVDAGAPVTP
jgi:ATP-binding cassette subfamily B protein